MLFVNDFSIDRFDYSIGKTLFVKESSNFDMW
jgi:hypothetical protein